MHHFAFSRLYLARLWFRHQKHQTVRFNVDWVTATIFCDVRGLLRTLSRLWSDLWMTFEMINMSSCSCLKGDGRKERIKSATCCRTANRGQQRGHRCDQSDHIWDQSDHRWVQSDHRWVYLVSTVMCRCLGPEQLASVLTVNHTKNAIEDDVIEHDDSNTIFEIKKYFFFFVVEH